jgi:trans-2,3-dihydro-3-hydroxyanthranilate isomerase
MRVLRYLVCDVFTDKPLAGNQLAVFTNGAKLDAGTMQALAREMSFSETTFVLPAAAGGHAKVRIFTPTRELLFAGHPILGTAFVIGGSVQLDVLQLETGSGIVPVRLEREGARVVFGWMDQPLPKIEPFGEAERLLAAAGVERAALPIEVYDNGMRHVMCALDSRDLVAELRPDIARLTELSADCFSFFAGEGLEYKTRMFAPRAGVIEDPATGSAAGPIGVHLARHGKIGFGDLITIEQGKELGRPSLLYSRPHGSAEKLERVEVGGSAVVVARGEFKF